MSDGGKGDKRRPGDEAAFSDGYDRIFGDSRPKRGKFVWDTEYKKFIPYEEYIRPVVNESTMVIGDLQPYKSMVDGKMIEGRKQHREMLKRNHLIEIGNETKHLKPYGQYEKVPGLKEKLIQEFQKRRK